MATPVHGLIEMVMGVHEARQDHHVGCIEAFPGRDSGGSPFPHVDDPSVLDRDVSGVENAAFTVHGDDNAAFDQEVDLLCWGWHQWYPHIACEAPLRPPTGSRVRVAMLPNRPWFRARIRGGNCQLSLSYIIRYFGPDYCSGVVA